MADLVIYDNDELAKKDTGWIINNECPLIIESTRAHSLEEYKEQFGQLQTVEGAVQLGLAMLLMLGRKNMVMVQ